MLFYAERMIINQLSVQNFRNIEHAQINVADARVIALTGPNGAGKTSLLEALSMLSPGAGLLKAKRDSQIQRDAPGWGLHAHIKTKEDQTIGMQHTRGKQRQLKIDGVIAERQTDLATLGNVLWFTPRLDRLFFDAASHRRDFLDRLTFGLFAAHAADLSLYRHHFKSRLRLLKQGVKDNDWLSLEEEKIVAHGLKVLDGRNRYLTALNQHLAELNLHITGSAHKMLHEDDPAAFFTQKLVEDRERDALYGSSHFGPHRSDIAGELLLDDFNVPLEQTSSGQHKKALLALLLAHARLLHAEHGRPPLVLFDEVLAHLDAANRAYIFNELAALGTQIWLAGTDAQNFADLMKRPDTLHLHVKNGLFQSNT